MYRNFTDNSFIFMTQYPLSEYKYRHSSEDHQLNQQKIIENLRPRGIEPCKYYKKKVNVICCNIIDDVFATQCPTRHLTFRMEEAEGGRANCQCVATRVLFYIKYVFMYTAVLNTAIVMQYLIMMNLLQSSIKK
uniref:Uncharacterized protein n=1 Tax=Glossina brevipalpis TaxID=37001 RepID=A0A1A9X2V2_9MUSC